MSADDRTHVNLDVAEIAVQGADGASGFEGLWTDHNTLDAGTTDERDVPKPQFIQSEAPGVGESSSKLPSTKRTTPLIYVHENAPLDIGFADVFWESQDYDAAARLEVVVADDMHGRTGKDMREDLIRVLENIRVDQRAPEEGVFNSEYRDLELGQIDRTPTRFTQQWRCYYDVRFTAFGVI